MTARTLVGAAAPRPADRRLAGLGTLVRKDATEWRRGRRAPVIAVVVTLFMTLTAANGWITSRLSVNLPPGAELPPMSLTPLDNLAAAVGAQVFVLAAILAVASLVVSERQAGTLAWVASKPVSRPAVWLSKWLTASALLGVAAVAVPLAATVAVVVVLYGAPDAGIVVGLAIGMLAVVAFFAAVGIAAGTVLPGQAGVTALGFGVFALPAIVGAVVPFDVTPVLPTSMLTWAAQLAAGAPAPLVTPLAWVLATASLVALGARRLDRMEL
jgi:ABC-2 type transport system permease protein